MVLFGELRPEAAIARASELTARPDLLLCVGFSLEVWSVAELPRVTLDHGGALAIVTTGPTPYDARATVKLAGDVVGESRFCWRRCTAPCRSRRSEAYSRIAMDSEETIGLVVIGAYVLLFWITRWRFVFRPSQHKVLARLSVVRAATTDPSEPDLLQLAQDMVECEEKPRSRLAKGAFWLFRFPTWNGSREIYAWRLVHEAERLGVRQLSPEDVQARLGRGLVELQELSREEAESWRGHLDAALATGVTHERARAMLGQYLRFLYSHRDHRSDQLSEGENKISWLVLACAIVLGVLVTDGFAALLGAGAIGGLLSRLQRVLGTPHDWDDYGLSWALLFLAPVAGALAAWAALLILVLLQDVGVTDIPLLEGDPLRDPDSAVLALALVLGFSERFFQMLADRTMSAAV